MNKHPIYLMTRLGALLFIYTIFVTSGCNNDPQNIVFMAGYKPQANLPFVSTYVAEEKGFYEDQNLKVTIHHASRGEHLQLLMSGEVDFTTAAATSVLKRRSDPEIPIVAFALLGQRAQQAYIALKKSGIEDVKDWEGKTFGYKISPPPDYLALLKANNVDRSKITEVNAGFDPRILTEGKVDILAIFKSNEPDTIQKLGFEITLWDPADYGVPSMGLTFITRQDIIENNPELVEKFLKATLTGTHYALQNQDETLDIIMKYAPNENRDHQKFMLSTELKDSQSSLTDQNGLGYMNDKQWKDLYDSLVEFEALPNQFDYQTAYTNEFLQSVYKDDILLSP